MKKIMLLWLLFPIAAFSIPTPSGSSQQRFQDETYQEAYVRLKDALPKNQLQALIEKETPVGKKVPFIKIDFSKVVEVDTKMELIYLFNVIRDTRFLNVDTQSVFKRRISWLYPDDGCFARAAVSGMKLKEEGLTRPSKLFAFGDLQVTTPYSPKGAVSWWYHVAPVVQYAGTVYVLDPALNPNGPLPVGDWYNKMGSALSLYGAVCNSYTYDPFDSCNHATTHSDSRALKDQKIYLDKEWNRIISLGLDPYSLLGKNPPWHSESPQ